MAKITVDRDQEKIDNKDLLTRTKAFNKAVKEQLDELEPSKDESNKNVDELARHILDIYDDAKKQRAEIEDTWLEDLRQYRGVYSPDVLSKMHPNRSKAFIRLTRTKVKTVDSRLDDFIFPANGDKNWGIETTPMAEYTTEQKTALAAALTQQTGQPLSPEQLQLMIDASAEERVKRMERVIDDQLVELRYRDVLKDVLHSGNLYGTGVLKGPMVNIKSSISYTQDPSSQEWLMQYVDNLTPFAESVSIWDIFPDLSATVIEDCNYIIQRHKMGKHKLIQLADRADFDGNAIREYIKTQEQGDFEDQHYDLALQSLGGLAETNTEQPDNKKYEVVEFWGYLDAMDLEQAGVTIPENKRGSIQLAANVWTLGERVIKVCLVPIEGIGWPYYFYYYDKDESSIFGQGIAAIMRDVQELINAAFRGMLDNAAISAGPQIEANLDLLPDDEDPTDIYPFKVWLRSGQGADAASPALRVYQIPSSTPEFIAMSELFEKYGDEVTTIPRYMWGDNPGGGAGRTASGLSMMMGSANITIKAQVKNFDEGITIPFISAMYHWNMQFNPDESIKGDFNIVAKGSSSLIAKEVYANSLMQFAQVSSGQQFAPLIKPDAVLRAIVEVLDLSDKGLIKSDQEIANERKEQAQRQAETQQFMSQMVEAAREHGISPQDMLQQGQMLLNQINQTKQQAGQQNVG